MITLVKNVNNFQIAKVQPHGVCLAFASSFCQFQPAIASKSVAHEKMRKACSDGKSLRKLNCIFSDIKFKPNIEAAVRSPIFP